MIWFLASFGVVDGRLVMVDNINLSVLAAIGSFIAPIFAPLGFGTWQPAVATIMGLVAKEEVVGVFGVLFGVAGDALEMVEGGAFAGLAAIAQHFTPLAAFSFLVFNLLCVPCFAALGAIKREMNNAKWTWFAIGYLCLFSYAVSLIVYQLGLLFTGASFTAGLAIALALTALLLYLLLRPYKEAQRLTLPAKA